MQVFSRAWALLVSVPLLAGAAEPLTVSVRPSGPSPAALKAVAGSLARGPASLRGVKGRWAVLSLQVVPGTQDRYRAVVFNYRSNQAWSVEGRISAPESAAARPLEGYPQASVAEFRDALKVLRRHESWGPALRRGLYVPASPMPPVLEGPAGTNRTVNVGLLATTQGAAQRIVGVDLVTESVVEYPMGAPETSIAATAAATCAPSESGQQSVPRGTAGQADVTISRGGTTLWEFTVVRPSVSSGVSGSGVELVDVRYRGKRVLARAHTPILAVKYSGNTCGPYRDWQWEENPFQANGSDVAPGIRAASSLPSTILESGNDSGNFSGVAYYVGPSSAVFQTELKAGWYRYIPKWTFHDDGRIQARLAFTAVQNGCVCNIHLHSGYFRLDFDIGGTGSTSIERRTQGGWQTVAQEAWGRRDRLGTAAWQVRSTVSGDTYRVTPGPEDAIADSFGVGDWWILKSKGTAELDDGISCITCANAYIQIGGFVNGESVQGTGVVLWYGAHFLHNIGDGDHSNEIVGPDLVPVSW